MYVCLFVYVEWRVNKIVEYISYIRTVSMLVRTSLVHGDMEGDVRTWKTVPRYDYCTVPKLVLHDRRTDGWRYERTPTIPSRREKKPVLLCCHVSPACVFMCDCCHIVHVHIIYVRVLRIILMRTMIHLKDATKHFLSYIISYGRRWAETLAWGCLSHRPAEQNWWCWGFFCISSCILN